jgi:hypothetical protein
MRTAIPGVCVALAVLFGVSGVSAAELESLAADSETVYSSRELSQAKSFSFIPATPKPVQPPWPYFPGTIEGKPSEFNSPLANFGMVMKGVYRGARPKREADYAFLGKMGIDTTINLQFPYMIFKSDPLLCSKYHLNCSYLPVKIIPRSDMVFGMDELKNAYKFTVDEIKAGKTVYVHCFYGQERTGLLVAALIVRERMCGPGTEGNVELKEKTWGEVDEAFRKYGYREVHQKPFTEMKTWISDFENNKSWICR